jgi:signal transduction histidine kinase
VLGKPLRLPPLTPEELHRLEVEGDFVEEGLERGAERPVGLVDLGHAAMLGRRGRRRNRARLGLVSGFSPISQSGRAPWPRSGSYVTISPMSVIRAAQVVLAGAGIALGVVAYRVQVENLGPFTTAGRSLAIVAVGWSFLVAGLVAWSRRAGNRMGPLMIAAGFALLLRQLRYSDDAVLFTVFFALGHVSYALVGHSVLAYPSGRVTDRYERAVVKTAYATVLAFPLAVLLFYDSTRPLNEFPSPRESLLLVTGADGLVEALEKAFVIVFYGVLATSLIALIIRRLVRATPRTRRILAPLLLAAAVVALRAVFECVFTFVDRPFASEYLFWWQVGGIIALPLALLAGLLRARLARVHVGELVVHLEHTPVDGIRDELARALDDRSLELGLWLPERGEYVDAVGSTFAVPDDGPRRAVTRIEHEGESLAVLVHDPSLRDEPKLVEAVAAAARFALVNARLHAEVRAQLETVKESRARIVSAADEERRRIERDLHDGAQQRLVALALELRSAQKTLGAGADSELDRLLATTADELQVAVEELRALAHGIHPGTLTQAGLASALESLAARMPLPVTVEAFPERLSPDVEATAYFVASEALANVVKHARASKAAIRARVHDESLVIEVEDDGIGGARPEPGSGLHGLADRVEAQGGHLRIESPPSAGTRVVAEVPCAS